MGSLAAISDTLAAGNEFDREMYANWYEWAYRTIGRDESKAHAAAWAAASAGARGADATEMQTLAKSAAKDKQAVRAPGADQTTRLYAQWFAWAVTKLGVTGEPAHRAAAAALTAEEGHRQLTAEKAAGVHGDASRLEAARVQREEAFARAQRECPFPVSTGAVGLPGGMQLMNDEFLVTSGRDWGFSSQQILITTHRAIWTHGRVLNKQQNAIYLTDIRDVVFRKPLIGYGSLAFETASGHVIEALPHVDNGAQVRNSLLTLIHYARNRTQQPTTPAVVESAPPKPAVDRYEQLRKLGELKALGILSEEEFQSEKAKILAS